LENGHLKVGHNGQNTVVAVSRVVRDNR